VKVATLNLGDGPDDAKARALATLVKHGADVICLQEAGDRGDLLAEFCRRTGWHSWLGDVTPGASSVPMLWNPRVVIAAHVGTTPATKATNAGPGGAGPNVVKAKVWNRVRFTDGTVVINGHLPASLYLPGRRRLGKQMIAVLVEMVKRREAHGTPVVVVGDFNARPSALVLKPLRELGMHQHTHAATHGRRTIDLTWTFGVEGTTEVLTVPSDHKAVLLTLG
jgi:exonuclease III